ncbi:hypothetical protein XELAEV_18031268mg [Xenopus laevis]|uniref:Ig-like domain-containing protein n=1 Tax=Xenopus laevis TaxID=8355 RepID=A0A974CNY7_XENLA|nr:hypothetical protein XELAEV_18031268mg [Xenopus laevis]
MILLYIYVLATFLAVGYSAVTIKQSSISITRKGEEKKSALILCQIEGSFTYIHWYKQKNNRELKRILYSTDGRASYEEDKYKDKFDISSRTDLRITNIERDDEATYYCACWDTAQRGKFITTQHKNRMILCREHYCISCIATYYYWDYGE